MKPLLLGSCAAVLATLVGTLTDPSWPLEPGWGLALAGTSLWSLGIARLSGARRGAGLAGLGLLVVVAGGWVMVEDRVPEMRLPAQVDLAGRSIPSLQVALLATRLRRRGMRRFCTQVATAPASPLLAQSSRVQAYDGLGFALPRYHVEPCTVLLDADLPATRLPQTGTYMLGTEHGGWMDFDPDNLIAPDLELLQHPEGVEVVGGGLGPAVGPLQQLPTLLDARGTGSSVRVRPGGERPWTVQQALSICLTAESVGFWHCHLR